MKRKEEERIVEIYAPLDIRRGYFVLGAGYLMGLLTGGIKGYIFSRRYTQGKPNGMRYFIRQEAQKYGAAFGAGALVSLAVRTGLEQITNLAQLVYSLPGISSK
ncbi:hypothetical protein NEOKW01_1235 [Nematocida sp. AWRm80]|nr:hypothetical protein NEOKW01_1235 [Nematocida sp. AWRm80]